MRLDDLRVGVLPGDGLVARFPNVLLVVLAGPPGVEAVGDELLEACRDATAPGGQAPGRSLARRLAWILAKAEPEAVPAFCAVADANDGLALILHGDADLETAGLDADLRLTGRDVATYVDRIIHQPFSRLTVTSESGDVVDPDDRLDLRDGVVPAGGVVLAARQGAGDVTSAVAAEAPPAVVAAAPAPSPPPAPVVTETQVEAEPEVEAEPGIAPEVEVAEPASPSPPQADQHVHQEPAGFLSMGLLEDEAEGEEREALPLADEAAPEELAAEAAPSVLGVHCKRDHFNNPDALFCGICGISMVHETRHQVVGPRPSLGFLVLDDGSTYGLEMDYTIGREPSLDPAVQNGEARPMVLTDAERTISRVHAAVRLDGWDVFVVDRGSANGTFVWSPGASDWTRLAPDQPARIRSGSHVLVGRRGFVFDSPYKH